MSRLSRNDGRAGDGQLGCPEQYFEQPRAIQIVQSTRGTQQAGRLIDALLQEPMICSYGFIILREKWRGAALLQSLVTMGNEVVHAIEVQFDGTHRRMSTMIHITTNRFPGHRFGALSAIGSLLYFFSDLLPALDLVRSCFI